MDELKLQELFIKIRNIKEYLFNSNQDDLNFTNEEWDLIIKLFSK